MVEESAKVIEKTREMLSAEAVKYPTNVLEAFGTGCLLDLRVRLAVDLLKSPMFSGELGLGSKLLAEYALDIATELLALSEERGLVSALPDDDGLNRQLRLQAVRTAKFSALQQIEGQRAAADEAGRVARPVPFGGKMNG